MKATKTIISTLREAPNDAVIASHQLMMRSGLIRKLGNGLYAYMPFGFRSLMKVEKIIREELDNAGLLEIKPTVIVPGDLWKESGRWDKMAGEMLTAQNRQGQDMVVSPTAEEAFTAIVREGLSSYKQLPFTLYQINTKYRVYIPYSYDDKWHNFEIIIDQDNLNAVFSLDGLTWQKTLDSSAFTDNYTMVCGGHKNTQNMYIVLKDLKVDLDGFGDAEFITNRVYPYNSSPTTQLISSRNPKVMIFEGHGIHVGITMLILQVDMLLVLLIMEFTQKVVAVVFLQ